MGLATSLRLCDEHTVQPGPGRADWAGNLVTAPCFACVLLVTDLKTRRRRDNPRGQGKLLQPCRRHHLVHPACGTEAGGWGGSVPGRRSGLTQCHRANAPQSQRTGPERSLGGGFRDSIAAPPSPPNAAARKQRFAGSRAQEGLCGWFRLRVPRWRQPDAGCWVGLCQHVVSGFSTWSLSHGRSGCPRSMLASGQSGHPHEGCGPSTRIPAQQAEPLCSATSFHDSCVTAPPTAQGKERSPVSHRLSTKAQEEHVEPEMPPQPALENATCPIMPAAVAPLGRSKRACRGEMEKNTRWLEVSSGKSKSLRIGSKNLFCIILETKVVSASVIRCRHAHVCARAGTHTPAALGTL